MYRPTIIYKTYEQDRANSFIHYAANRVLQNNKNFLCAVTGPTGAGKSWLSGSCGEEFSKITGIPFKVDTHVIFSLKELLDLINNKEVDKILKPGTFILFDEPQVSVNARQWQSEANQILATLTSTFRNMRLIIFFATPYMEFLDKQSRILFHAEVNVQGFDKTTNYTSCKPRLLEWNGRKQEFYKKRLIVRYPDPKKNVSSWYYLQHWEVHRPSKEWIEAYEKRKKAFTTQLNRELQQQYEYMQSQHNKGKDLVALSELYELHGENYRLFAKELPHLTPYNLERLVAMIKKQKKAEEKALKDKQDQEKRQNPLENAPLGLKSPK